MAVRHEINEYQREYLACAVAPSTAASYRRAFGEWQQKADLWKIPAVPVSPLVFGNFIAESMAQSPSLARINLLTAAVADRHWSNYYKSPTEDPTFRRLLAGIRRKHAKPAKSKAPLTLDLLQDAFFLVQESGRLQEWRTLARINTEFYAGLRWDEVSALRMEHLRFTETGVTVHVARSKTDQIGKGDVKTIMSNDSACCPVQIIRRYIAMLRYGPGDNGFFQPRIRTDPAGSQRGLPDTKLAYTAALQELKTLLAFLGRNPEEYGEHSGRRGGATTASEAGARWTDLKIHGRWKSDTTAQKYIEATAKKRNTIPQVLAAARSSQEEPTAAPSEYGLGRSCRQKEALVSPTVRTEEFVAKPSATGGRSGNTAVLAPQATVATASSSTTVPRTSTPTAPTPSRTASPTGTPFPWCSPPPEWTTLHKSWKPLPEIPEIPAIPDLPSLGPSTSGRQTRETPIRFASFKGKEIVLPSGCLLYTSPSPRDRQKSRMPSSA